MKAILLCGFVLMSVSTLNAQTNSCFSGTDTLTYSVNSADALCSGSCDGEAILSFSSGSGNYVVTWSGPSFTGTGTSVSGLCAGSYSVVVADTSFGIVCTATFTINEPPPISIVNTNSVNASNGNCDGELGYTVTGGVSPYIFVLDTCHGGSPVTTPQFMSSYNNLCPGAYTLNVTDVNGCIASGPCDTLVECNIQFTGAISHPTCPNACDGSIVLNAISPNLSFYGQLAQQPSLLQTFVQALIV